MTTVEKINEEYANKLIETRSHDQAIMHIYKMAYDAGIKSVSGERSQLQGLFDDMLGNPMNDLNKLSIKDDGWIEWNGGDMPVDGDLTVKTKFRDGYCFEDKAMYFRWSKWIRPDDIIAYKVISSG